MAQRPSLRPGAWRRVWDNFVASLTRAPREKIYHGEDAHGNRFYEYKFTRSNVKRLANTFQSRYVKHEFLFNS